MKFIKLFLFYSIIILLFSLCSKNPFDSVDINEELILFIRYGCSSELCVIRPDGSNLQVIGSHEYIMARWSPDKSKIVIVSPLGSAVGEWRYPPLWLMNMYGRILHQLTPQGSDPVWSHDGEYILFQGGYKFVASVNIDGTGTKAIYEAEDSTSFHLSDISASGEYILGTEDLYYTNEEGKLANTDNEIVKIHLETGEKMYLTDNELSDYCPRYNSDETKIAYFSIDIPAEVTVNEVTNVYVMSIYGSNKRKVTNETLPNSIYPFIAWSPDGNKIAYSKDNDIFIVDIQFGIVYNLTNTAKDGITNMIMDWK